MPACADFWTSFTTPVACRPAAGACRASTLMEYLHHSHGLRILWAPADVMNDARTNLAPCVSRHRWNTVQEYHIRPRPKGVLSCPRQ